MTVPPDKGDSPYGKPYLTAILIMMTAAILAFGFTSLTLKLIQNPYQAGMEAGMGLSGFQVPGNSTNWSFEPGDYRIFYIYRAPFTVGGAAPYASQAAPPDFDCSVTSDATGELIPIYEPTTYREYHNAQMDGIAVAGFNIDRVGAYELDCAYADGDTAPTVLLMQGHITLVTSIATVIAFVLPWFAGLCPVSVAVVAIALLTLRRSKEA